MKLKLNKEKTIYTGFEATLKEREAIKERCELEGLNVANWFRSVIARELKRKPRKNGK